jgi:hypothetical protein
MNVPIAQAEETGDLTTPVTLTGSYTPRTDLQLNFAGASGARTLAATFVAGSDQPGSLTAVAGNYSGISGHTGGRRSAIFSIDAGEALKGSNGACSFAGTVKPRQSGNVFDFSVYAVGVETCIFNRGPIGGVAYYDEAARQFHGFASFFGTELWYLIGTKP